ncbi:PREDICTED: tetratricopeptide repeat protein 14 homolog [Rhagoletis zephyria]|uniref:tetratricopeptide repeat protein 14 homolog n=1 Tax=Rhagoletis zephyria TaxID=28612 RepID=UPI000811469A|nr:PREDICTED: tetratricopeptide repeat protein 14 homolog [Rhagoletis zephyria]XP_017478380.1 PREDICTED: tetratricopeptide repeat protein 14 homolog [Rhagoletis zephyria]
MNSNYITRALCFHGQPMQKIWEDERGAGSLQQCGVPAQPDYSIYQERQKYFTFQDRAKRLKLHQFFARKAPDLYDADLSSNKLQLDKVIENEQHIASLPPYELFVNKNKDKQKRCRCVLEALKPGDIIYCMVTKPTANMVHPLCMGEPMVRYLSDIPIKAYLMKAGLDSNGKPRLFSKNDLVRCEVLETSVDAERIYLSLESVHEKNKDVTLGVVTQADLPKYYRQINENKLEKYEEYMLKSKEFLNPNYDMLYEIVGLDVNETYTYMSSLKNPFPRNEYAKELRRTQASKWAFRSVAEGIEHFKNGNHVEAFQCLNKALSIDPRNVEGLVARGALYANKGSFLKAVDDFEKALKLNSYHVNARKYMGETLVALGRRYEDENRIKDATKAYQDCLNIIPNHEQARLSLEAIQQRTSVPYFENVVTVPGEQEELDLERETEKISVHDSSSGEGSTSSGSGSETEPSDNEENGKESSLSPLSKRMALHVASLQKEEESKKQLNQPFYMSAYNVPPEPVVAPRDINEFRLDDDDTGSRVRKLLQEASKHKKEKKKTKKKKSKKSKKVSRKEKNAASLLSKINFQDAYKAISSMNIENKLTENLQKYEKTIAQIKKRQSELVESIEAGMAGRERSETPPPRAPSMRLPNQPTSSYGASSSSIYSSYPSTSAAAAAAASKHEPAKLSFQIKRPVTVDKIGFLRIATPLAQKSPSSRSRSRTPSRERRRRSRSRSRYRSLSRGRRGSRRRSRSRSIERGGRRRGSRGRRSSRSRSPYRRSRSRPSRRTRSRSRSPLGRSRRDSLSPRGRRRELGRGSARGSRPSPPRRKRSISPIDAKIGRGGKPKRGGRGAARGAFGNRVWRREDAKDGQDSNGRWLHDRYEEINAPNKVDDGPSIEEIDEIINRAQKERKQEIIQRDKDILKKPIGGRF